MGRRAGTGGHTMLVFLTWIRMLRLVLPSVVLFENVLAFPLELLSDLVGYLYSLDDGIFDPSTLG